MKRSNTFIVCFILLGVGFMATLIDVSLKQRGLDPEIEQSGVLVQQLGLSDLSLFTEARYTRHPNLADRHSAFQDHPMAIEHFPSGSLLLPPRSLTP
jgi:hypothetical protein